MDSLGRLKGQWDRVAAIVLTLVGGLILILGWFGVSGQGLTSEQIPYVVSGGLGGIFLMGVGAALWLSADLRDEWTKLDRIEKVLESGLDHLGLGRSADGRPTLAPLDGVVGSQQASLAVASGNGDSGGRSDVDDTREIAALRPVAAKVSQGRSRATSSKPAGSSRPTASRSSKKTSTVATKTAAR